MTRVLTTIAWVACLAACAPEPVVIDDLLIARSIGTTSDALFFSSLVDPCTFPPAESRTKTLWFNFDAFADQLPVGEVELTPGVAHFRSGSVRDHCDNTFVNDWTGTIELDEPDRGSDIRFSLDIHSEAISRSVEGTFETNTRCERLQEFEECNPGV